MRRITIGIDCCDALDCPAAVPQNVCNTDAFLHIHAGFARTVEQNRIEDCPANRKPAIAVAAKPVLRSELPVNRCAVGRMHAHSRKLRCARTFDCAERIHRVQ